MDRKTAAAKAKALVSQMTLEEKMSQMLYKSPAIPRLGIYEYNWWNEALHGVARAGTATSFPQAIGMGAMFEEFLKERGTELKSEFYIPFVVAEMIHNGKANVKVLRSADSWFGVTYREDKPRVQADIKALIAKGVYPENLFA